MLACLGGAKAKPSWHASSAWVISEPEVWAIATDQIEPPSPGYRIGMVETTKNTGDKTLTVTPTKTLTLKPRGVEQGVVRQSFSHGRTKAVVVEKVKRRVGAPAKAEAAPAADTLTVKRAGRAAVAPPPAAAPQAPAAPP